MSKQNLTTIHKFPLDLLDTLMEIYLYRNEGLDALMEDVWSVVKDTPERLLHYDSYKEDLKLLCVETGLCYKNVHREFLLIVNWVHVCMQTQVDRGWFPLDLVISENFDVLFHYSLYPHRKKNDPRIGSFRYHLPFQGMQHPTAGFEEPTRPSKLQRYR